MRGMTLLFAAMGLFLLPPASDPREWAGLHRCPLCESSPVLPKTVSLKESVCLGHIAGIQCAVSAPSVRRCGASEALPPRFSPTVPSSACGMLLGALSVGRLPPVLMTRPDLRVCSLLSVRIHH